MFEARAQASEALESWLGRKLNVEKVVDAVHDDLIEAVQTGTLDRPDFSRVEFERGVTVAVAGSNYLQAIDLESLAYWAVKSASKVRLRVRPGDYVPLGLPVAEVHPARDDASKALEGALAFGRQPAALQDLEFTVRQLSEIAVRALSPGINDPFTAASVIERFGDALCRIAPRFLPTGAVDRDGQIVLLHPVTDYDGLCDGMFHTIRQNASGSGFVLVRMLDVLTKVAERPIAWPSCVVMPSSSSTPARMARATGLPLPTSAAGGTCSRPWSKVSLVTHPTGRRL